MLNFVKRFKKLTLMVIGKQIPFITVLYKKDYGVSKTISVISCPEIKAFSHVACICKGYNFSSIANRLAHCSK